MYASRLRNRALAVSAAFTLGASGAFAQTSPFEVEGKQLDIRLGAETQSGGWTLTEGLNPDTLTVPIARRDGRVRACLALGQRAHCQEVGVGERHDFVVRSGGKDYPTRFEGVYRAPMAVFDAAYRAERQGRISADIPEVYELVNVAIALTSYAAEKPGLVYVASPYHEEVMARYDTLKDHPFVLSLDKAMRADLFNYFHLKMNGYAFVYGADGRIERSRIYDRTGFNGRPSNDLAPLLAQMQDFSDKAAFRTFFAEHQALYQQQKDFYRDKLDLAGMQDWLRSRFPGVKPYDTINLVFSPLVFGSQSVTWITVDGFSELQPHVNFPYPDVVEKDLSPEAAALRRGYIAFTEINHGFINPTADRHGARVAAAIADRKRWAKAGTSSDSYSSNASVFNELMNWGLVSLYVVDKAPPADQAKMLADLDVFMSARRGFVGFPEFNAFLVDLYRKRAPGKTVEDLYPDILTWFEARRTAPPTA